MYYPAEIVYRNYKPLEFELGQQFVTKLYPNTEKEYIEFWELNRKILNPEEFVSKNGYPIEFYIVDSEDNILAMPNQIGWFDEGDNVPDYRDITLTDLNRISNVHNGFVEIEINDEHYVAGIVFPTLINDKVIIREPVEEYYDEDPYEDLDEDDLDKDFEELL